MAEDLGIAHHSGIEDCLPEQLPRRHGLDHQSVTHVGDWVFPQSVTHVGNWIFPQSVTHVGNWIFTQSVTHVGNWIFTQSVTHVGNSLMVLESYQAIYFLKIDGPGIIPGNLLSKDRWSWNHTRQYSYL